MSKLTERRPYFLELKRLMDFLGRGDELQNPDFSANDLADITPEDICRYFYKRAYGTDRPTDSDLPIHARSNSILASKKQISFFMPRQNVVWDDIRREGNPTKSIVVNKLINKIRKHEVRREGVQSNARRPIEFAEFTNILSIIRKDSHYGGLKRWLLGAIITVQWQLIARLDDAMKLRLYNISYNPVYLFVCQMTWSKNITEESESPRQLLLGSMDERVCVLLNLGVYLELCESKLDDFIFASNGSDGEKNRVRNYLSYAIEHPSFKELGNGKLGTHSFRKGPATYASRCGISKEAIEIRGRWRSSKRIVDTYIDIQRPYPDAQVACCLCGPSGPIKYKIIDECTWLDDSFLFKSIAPKICALLGPKTAVELAKPLIYAAIKYTASEDNDYILLPESLQTRIIRLIVEKGGYASPSEVTQLIERVPIVLTGNSTTVNFTEICDETLRRHTNSSNGNAVLNEVVSISANLFTIKKRVEEIYSSLNHEILELRKNLNDELSVIKANIRRIACQPVVRTAVSEQSVAEPSKRIKLSNRPRDLFQLWREYTHGLEGNTPARCFSKSERGTCRWIYSHRLGFWRIVDRLIGHGYTSDTAIDAVYAAYGRSSSVTSILRSIRADKYRGGHPNLR